MTHPNEDLLRSAYEAFGKGDIETVSGVLADDIVWHIPGKSSISGDRSGKDDVLRFFGELVERSGGTFRLEMHDILADDEHGVVLVQSKGERDGKTLDDHTVHVFHLRDGKATEFWGHAGDQYAVDDFWG